MPPVRVPSLLLQQNEEAQPTKPTLPAQMLQKAEQWAENTLKKGVEALYHEFMDLRQWTPPGMTSEAFDVSI
jgi:hypothetical protein